ncbi:MAG: 5'-3' exonuclease H3TH domain-containing protein [Candidatus Peribacteraceae bacterium]|jgi:DNA polymerase-1
MHSTDIAHLVLLDGHHLMYRAYWAIPRTLKTSAGEQVNTVFGVASMLLSILAQEEPDGLLVCFDEGEETFRHEEAEDYKGGRAETPDDFYTQIPRVIELIDAFGFHHVSDSRYEADDLLCSYARAGEKEGMRVSIVSGDRDLLQLASETIAIVIPHKGYQKAERLGPAEVEAKYGIRPDQVVAYKGLCGDASDNLPGVLGIGPKTAAQLIQQYDSLTEIYAHLDAIRPAVREKLERDREQAFFCERMSQLLCDIALPVPLKELAVTQVPTQNVAAFFREMEFTLLFKRLQSLLGTAYGTAHFQPSDVVTTPAHSTSESQLSLFS